MAQPNGIQDYFPDGLAASSVPSHQDYIPPAPEEDTQEPATTADGEEISRECSYCEFVSTAKNVAASMRSHMNAKHPDVKYEG